MAKLWMHTLLTQLDRKLKNFRESQAAAHKYLNEISGGYFNHHTPAERKVLLNTWNLKWIQIPYQDLRNNLITQDDEVYCNGVQIPEEAFLGVPFVKSIVRKNIRMGISLHQELMQEYASKAVESITALDEKIHQLVESISLLQDDRAKQYAIKALDAKDAQKAKLLYSLQEAVDRKGVGWDIVERHLKEYRER